VQARVNERGHMVYSDHRHAFLLSKAGFSYEEIVVIFKKTTNECARWLFPDALDLIHSLKKYGEPLILLSLGDPNFQGEKVRGTGIGDFFDQVFMISDSKIRVISELASEMDVSGWLINDKITETQEIVAAFPNIQAVLKMSPMFSKDEYGGSGLASFQSLLEIGHHIRDNSIHISVGAVIYKKDTNGVSVLIMYRKSTETFHLPKGTSEFGETIEDTLKREVYEETGLDIAIEQYLDIARSTYTYHEKVKHKKTHYFLAQYKSGEAKPLDGEHDTVEFLSLEKALDLFRNKGAHLTLGYENELEILEQAKKILSFAST
jgi:8-oxo-dGTP pyrophosphatase MutT (NUDIX family)